MKRVLRVSVLYLLVAVGISHAGALPPGSVVDGKTLAEWSAEWWKWALSYPVDTNPLLDRTGDSVALGDQGAVFFLAGSFGGKVQRSNYAIPADKYLFFPVLNSFLAIEGTVDEMRDRLAAFIGNTTDLFATVDGEPIPDLFARREISPVFDITLGDDNIFGAPSGVYTPAVSDGYWVMLEPLAKSRPIINFGGSAKGTGDPSFGDFSVDITYTTPEPGSFALLAGGAALLWFVRRRTTRRA